MEAGSVSQPAEQFISDQKKIPFRAEVVWGSSTLGKKGNFPEKANNTFMEVERRRRRANFSPIGTTHTHKHIHVIIHPSCTHTFGGSTFV